MWLRVVAVVALLAIVIGAAALWRPAAEGLLWQILAPLMSARNALSASESTVLRDELARAKAELADREVLLAENTELKRLLGRGEEGSPRVLATVLARPPFSPYDTLVIDIGEAHGVSAGDVVFAGGANAIGTVREVSARSSRVILYSAPGEEHQVLLRGTVPLPVAGQGGGSLIGELPTGSAVAPGDSVVFPDIAARFIATVVYVEESTGESFINVYLRLPVNPEELRFVEVSLSPQ